MMKGGNLTPSLKVSQIKLNCPHFLVPFLNIFEMPYATVLFNSHQTIKKKNICRKDLPIYDNIVFEPTVVYNYLVLLNILLSWKGFIFFPQF